MNAGFDYCLQLDHSKSIKRLEETLQWIASVQRLFEEAGKAKRTGKEVSF